MSLPAGYVDTFEDNTLRLNWRDLQNKSSFYWEVEKDIVLDGYPYEYNEARSLNMTGLEIPPDFGSIAYIQGATACVGNHRWTQLTIDPTFTSLFAAQPTSKPASPKSRLNPAAYAVPIALVVLAIVVIIILMATVPAVRYKLLPFSKRRKPMDKTGAAARPSSWNSGKKPEL